MFEKLKTRLKHMKIGQKLEKKMLLSPIICQTWNKVDKFLNVTDSDFILDVGCGGGVYERVLAPENPSSKIIAIDISKGKGEAWEIIWDNVYFVIADAQNLPFKDGVFDKIFSIEVLEHLPDERRALNDIYRVLKPSGAFVLTAPHLTRVEKPIIPLFDLHRYLNVLLRKFPYVLKVRILAEGALIGFNEWEKKHGHVRHGYDIETVSNLLMQTNFCLCHTVTVYKVFSAFLLDLAETFRPFQIVLYRFPFSGIFKLFIWFDDFFKRDGYRIILKCKKGISQ